jgi:hypothetical protein
MGSNGLRQKFEDCDNAAGDLEHMAALFRGWWDGTIEGRGFNGDTCKLSLDEYNLIAFVARDLAERSERVSRMVGNLPR